MRIRYLLVAAALFGLVATLLTGQSSAPPVVTGNARVDKLLSQMTLEEKIELIHGGQEASPSGIGQAGTWPGLPRLGIPSLRFTDGPPGISVSIWSTGMTSTMGLAATWSREDAQRNGVVIGRDARALGQDVVLQPFVNIVRDFTFSRAHNTFGEDPFLSGQLAAAQIRGTQGEGVMSQIKHFIGYDGANDVVIDPQTLREIYIAPFADASAAGVSSFMCSYNKINGPYACGNGEIQNRIFRGEYGFKGFNTSDWGGTHGTLFVNEGLDLEMPGGTFFGAVPGQAMGRGAAAPGGTPGAQAQAAGRGAALPGGAAQANPGGMAGGPGGPGGPGRGGAGMPEERAAAGAQPGAGRGGRGADAPSIGMLEAVRSGQVKEAAISLAVGRILVQMDKFGYLDKAPSHTIRELDYASNQPVLRKTAEDSATLLKNDGNVLPLATADLSSVVFIGPTGGLPVSVGQSGERAMGLPDRQVGPVPAIEQLASRKVAYFPANDFDGRPVPASAISGLVRTNPATNQTQNDSVIDFTSANGKALPPGSTFTWSGTLNVPSAGSYVLALQSRGATAALAIDGNPAIAAGGGRGFGGGRGGAQNAPPLSSLPGLKGNHPLNSNITPTADHLANARTRVDLTAGAHPFTVTLTGETNGFPVQIRFAWVTPEQAEATYSAAVNAAKSAKKAVVFAWGRDRPEVFRLTLEQTRLINDVAAVNPNTVVVLNTSLPVEMPWLPKVKGVLQMWWPGDEGGPATAAVLLGRVSPAGRLPITWPESMSQMVAQDPKGHPDRTNSGVDGKTTYSEGIFVGYRWFDQQNIKPLFPFGHGLSYAVFQYSGLKVAAAKDGGLDVSFTLRNTGKMTADEVPQVYLGAPSPAPAGAQFAVRALAQFDRVTLPAGAAKAVTLHVEPRRLQYWSTAANKWERAGGRTVYVGASSRDIRLQAEMGK